MAAGQKRKIWWAISLFLLMLYFSGLTAQAQYGGGNGTAGDPYLIYTAEQMNVIGTNPLDWDKHFKLMADIDLSGFDGKEGRPAFNIIAPDTDNSKWWFQGTSFTGVFDGNSHTISNLIISGEDYLGMFGQLESGAVVKDLGVVEVNITSSGDYYVGGMVGHNRGTITDCYATGSILGNTTVGGLVGENRSGGTITNCYSAGSVTGNKEVSGLVGSNYATITNCYATGSVSGTEDVGGLVGLNDGNVYSSFWDIETSGQTTSDGGTGKTTAEMQMASTFVGWGCDPVWTIDEGKDYPRLWWENMPGEPITTVKGFYGGGCGTEEDPYLIYTAVQMNAIGANPNDWDKHFKLMADIDLSAYSGTRFNIIGIGSKDAFTGVFDGNGKKISNFNCTTPTDNIGLFRYVRGLIKDLGLINPNVDAGTGRYVGALLGHLRDGTITGCYAEGGSVSGGRDVGGLVGENENRGGSVLNCYSTGAVSGVRSVGGLVGNNPWGTITNCYSAGSVTGNEDVGGLAGYNYGTITNCYSSGDVSGIDSVGGLVGALNKGTITNCYSASDVSGDSRVGGLVGYNLGTISNCYDTGSVLGNEKVGGLVGQNGYIIRRGGSEYTGVISNCYSTGSVSGGEKAGGLVGYNELGTIANSFWDIQTSGQVTSDGGTGKTTAQMKTASTFLNAGWDFVGESVNGTEDIWWILEGPDYPRLLWEFLAFSPHPANGAVDVIQPLILSWVTGVSDLHHDIYFGEDEQAVADATTENPVIYLGRQPGEMTTYDPGPLELGETYYWRIDEVNEAETNSPWKGYVWSFTTVNFIVVDGFEDYNDYPGHRIYETWSDGWEIPTNGATLGYPEPLNFAAGEHILETTNVHGGEQSLPFFYDNTTAVSSEASVNIANLVIDRDWTKYGATVLSLWFHGYASNAAEPMYVAISNYNGPTAVVDNPDAALIETWTEWTIDLQKFAVQGVDLANVDTISIGFGDKNPDVSGQPGGSGLVFFDDIRLYRLAPEPEPAQ